jgi:secondary thiamine-phosphate synthase enzyme
MIRQKEIELPVFSKGFHLITPQVEDAFSDWPREGLCHIFILHTSAALALNEAVDPDVRHDMNLIFDRLVPENQPYYTHTDEGPDDMPAHAKSVLADSSLMIPVSKRQLRLGRWQGIYLCEFRRNAGRRKIVITLYH